jgi:hypothetical protein
MSEYAPAWRKSSRSNSQGGDCVELADLGRNSVGIRDSKAPEAGRLTVTPKAVANLVGRIKTGVLDLK